MDNSEITIKFIEPTEEQKREYEGFRKLINSWFHLFSVDQDKSNFYTKVKETASNPKYHDVVRIDFSDLVPEVTIKRSNTPYSIIVSQVVEVSHDT